MDRAGGLAEARAVAAYLGSLRQLVAEATAARQSWIRQLGSVIKDARLGGEQQSQAVSQAGEIGHEQRAQFEEMRNRLGILDPPERAQGCHLTVQSWLEKQIAACDVMIEVSRTGDIAHLRAAQGLLAEGREDTRRFTIEYGALVDWVRQTVAAGRARRQTKVRWPFGRAPRSSTA